MKRMEAITYTVTVTSQQSGAMIGEDMFRASLHLTDELLWWLNALGFWLQVLALALDAGLGRTWRAAAAAGRWISEGFYGAGLLAQEIKQCFDAKPK